ncbi:hypothetical protein NSND_60199 [Nitrospira sp. ND1]|nr:hypothetical protein NSND_60199 [Nitrospira sp. ND1]
MDEFLRRCHDRRSSLVRVARAPCTGAPGYLYRLRPVFSEAAGDLGSIESRGAVVIVLFVPQ